MENKKTFGGFIKENKGKIIKGGLIVVGLVAGVVIYKTLTAPSAEHLAEGEKIIEAFSGLDNVENIGDAAEIVENVVV